VIFDAARDADAVVLTKDQDFVDLVERLGPPPRVLWVTIGNTSNAHLKDVLQRTLAEALELIEKGERLVEITEAPRNHPP
jgi:predicted nuclease of predicted toxin-antitoxin system